MFCKYCGAEIGITDVYCKKCGGRNETQITQNKERNSAATQKNKKVKTSIYIIGVLVIVLIFVTVFLLRGRSYERAVDQFCDAVYTADAKALVDLLPKTVLDNVLEQNGYNRENMDEFIQEGEKSLQEQAETLELFWGGNVELTPVILNDEEIIGEELDELKDSYEEMNVKISAAKNVEVGFDELGGVWENTSINIPLIKSGRSWYIDVLNLEEIL